MKNITRKAAVALLVIAPAAALAGAEPPPTQVPEPGAFGLMAIGLVLVAALKYKNRNK